MDSQTEAGSNFFDFASDLARVFVGYKASEAEVDIARYDAQVLAWKEQQAAQSYQTQSNVQPFMTAGLPGAGGGFGTLLMLALVAGSVYLIAKQ